METNPQNADENPTPNEGPGITTPPDQATVGRPEPDDSDTDGVGADGGDFRG